MFRAFGLIIVLYAITQFMSSSFHAFDRAVTTIFETVEIAAQISKDQLLLQNQR